MLIAFNVIYLIILETFENIFNLCESKDKIFEDNLFPPNDNSLIKGLIKTSDNITNKEINKWKNVKWIRIIDVYEHLVIFNDLSNLTNDIEANNIKQGALKNSFFLSALASISEYPERIYNLFLTKEANKYGIYGVKLCIDGEWKEILIDDYFPCDNKKNALCFSSCNNNSLWVPILEKCYSKAYGSYYKIEDNNNLDYIMRDLTGAPIISLDNSNESLLNHLREACSKKWIVTASAGDTQASMDLLKEVGLLPLHAYSILEIHELPYDDENNSNIENYENVLKIRNPWTKNEWIGDWSDFSNLWKDDLKKKLNYCNTNGAFYMNFKDFKHYFSKVQICKYYSNYTYQSQKLNQKLDDYNLIRLSVVNNSSNVFISLIQQDKRNFNPNSNYKYSIAKFIVCLINSKKEIEYLGGKMGQDREISEERELDVGEYLIFTEIDWHKNNENLHKEFSFVFSINSSSNIKMELIDNETKIKEYPQILQTIYKSCAIKQNNYVRFTNDGAPDCLKYSNVTPEGYAYIYFENNELDATLIEDVKYTRFEGLKLLPPFSGTSYYVEVKPKQTQIVLIKQIDLTGFNLIYSYHSNFQYSQERLLNLTKSKGNKTYRKDPKLNIDVDIIIYTYKHSLGLCFYYENNTTDRKLEETLKIKATGVEILGCEVDDENKVYIVLGPNEKKLIEIKAKKNNWSVKSSVFYKLESL